MSANMLYGLHRSSDDLRDYTFVARPELLSAPPPSVDLRSQCGTIYDQLPLQSCSAHALTELLEFVGRKDGVTLAPPSRLFLYYNERVLAGNQLTDSGSTLRNGMKTIVTTGVCAESLWPYDPSKFSLEPTPECYESAKSTRAVTYYRIDGKLGSMKACLTEGYPFAFGADLYMSAIAAQSSGAIALPQSGEAKMGGHAMMAVGYDDATQEILVQNSLGPTWGLAGFATLPYAYVTNADLAYDFWMLRTIS